MNNQKLDEMEQFELIDREDEKITIVPRDKSWLEANGILQYDKLPVSHIARKKNENLGKYEYMCLVTQNPCINGVEISEEEYKRLLTMDYQEGIDGLEILSNAFEDSKTVEPTNESLNYVMCEVYVRLETLFPDQDDSWRKRETIFYFGGIPDSS